MRSILPIGLLFSASLILSNTAYLYLSVAYIQMLKVVTPVSVFLISLLTPLNCRHLFPLPFSSSRGHSGCKSPVRGSRSSSS